MATTQLGQFRFPGSGCVADYASQLTYVKSAADITTGSSSDSSSSGFQDVAIIPNAAFSKGQDYYLKVQIPQDMNYAMEFTIKLSKDADKGTETYQYIKTVNVNAGGTRKNVYDVALYEKEDGTVSAMIPLKYGNGNIAGMLYFRESDRQYYLGTGGTSYKQTDKRNVVSLAESWRNDVGERYGVFEMIFRPVEDGFTSIVLSMTRQSEDYNIQRTTSSGIEYGRKVDITKMSYSLMQITNLVTSMNSNSTLDRIGVWGHSGLMMAVNGEEIKIGPSGFYELSEVPVSSLGVVAKDYNDSFTIDYEFTQRDTEEEGE